MKRANSDSQKEGRRQDIVDRARGELQRAGIAGLRLQDVADSLGLVKGTLYRYFPTRQDLILAVYRHELETWLAAWRPGTDTAARAPAELGRLWLASLTGNDLLLRLIGSFHALVEAELSAGGLRDFKHFLRDFVLEAGGAVETLCPVLAGMGVRVIMDLYVLVQGAAPLCRPADAVARLLEADESLALFRLDIAQVLGPLLETYMQGLALQAAHYTGSS